jgi:hypothetical protein
VNKRPLSLNFEGNKPFKNTIVLTLKNGNEEARRRRKRTALTPTPYQYE